MLKTKLLSSKHKSSEGTLSEHFLKSHKIMREWKEQVVLQMNKIKYAICI
jgi:hypothetical protein